MGTTLTLEGAGFAACAQTASAEPGPGVLRELRDAIRADDGQVPATRVELHIEFDGHARLVADEGPGLGARRGARPAAAGLEAGLAVGGMPGEVDLVGRRARAACSRDRRRAASTRDGHARGKGIVADAGFAGTARLQEVLQRRLSKRTTTRRF